MGNTPSCPAPPQKLGFGFEPASATFSSNVAALQTAIDTLQNLGCSKYYQDMLKNINDMMKGDEKPKKSAEFILEITEGNTKSIKNLNLPADTTKIITDALNNLAITIITNTSTNGMMDPVKFKQSYIDALNSFCPQTSPTSISKSNFGDSDCGCTIWIILLLVVLLVVGYIYNMNKDTIKLPTLPQRIAKFGRQIKSIKAI